jgi:hypothetical protein
MRAVVTGMIATYPVGGVAWDYGQYALGLERLGFEVYYLEDAGLPSFTYDPAVGGYVEDCSHGVRFLQESLELLTPTLGRRWHFRSNDGRTFGMDAAAFAEVVAHADVLVNVSGGCLLREEYRRCRRKVFIDTDPGWNHFVIFPRWDAKSDAERGQGFRGHDYFFTYAWRLGKPDCPLGNVGLDWKPTRPPVVLDCWRSQPPGQRWTTMMMWNNYEKPVVHNGVAYGAKEREFGRVEELPHRTPAPLEVAVYAPQSDAPVERWRERGWSVVDGRARSATAAGYRDYLSGSRGEFSVAKNIYVATRCGWFSCRSVCYLAAGRPVVVQDTGFTEVVPAGRGLFAFSAVDDAAAAIAAVEDEYPGHAAAAREIACEYFDSDKVLKDLLRAIGLE